MSDDIEERKEKHQFDNASIDSNEVYQIQLPKYGFVDKLIGSFTISKIELLDNIHAILDYLVVKDKEVTYLCDIVNKLNTKVRLLDELFLVLGDIMNDLIHYINVSHNQCLPYLPLGKGKFAQLANEEYENEQQNQEQSLNNIKTKLKLVIDNTHKTKKEGK